MAESTKKVGIQGTIAGISGSPQGFIFVLSGPKGVIQLDMDLIATKEFAQQYDVTTEDPKELVKQLSKKVFNKRVTITLT